MLEDIYVLAKKNNGEYILMTRYSFDVLSQDIDLNEIFEGNRTDCEEYIRHIQRV